MTYLIFENCVKLILWRTNILGKNSHALQFYILDKIAGFTFI